MTNPMYINCAACLRELPDGVAPRDYARLNVAVDYDHKGDYVVQVWCVRHERHVATLSATEIYPPMPLKCGVCGEHHHGEA